uniref:Transmembrane protein n=1 Tax=Pithovirus LCPAC403 TaxID=2506596 RepID=A0A481ZCX5_9VIRU|nr:MAG: uncharacterized protein LCPAC403_01240 [Pithovirus LCPAC403]
MYHNAGFTFSYVTYVIAIILFIVAVVFAVWYFSLENNDNEKRRDIIEKKNTAELFFLGAIALVLVALYSGARSAAMYGMENNLFDGKVM